ncbi:MAG: LPS export ABC transporter periplasmic protein LptC [Chitinispirillaceae bacterium]|nr:LPS export ABC transporter periplasmic protein LptC [Chitinispirillaceae bacterium]
MNKRVFILLFLVTVMIVVCNRRKESIPVANSKKELPLQELSEGKIRYFNKKYLQWELESEYMCKPMEAKDYILVAPVKLTIFDSLGRISTKVLADSGRIGNRRAYYIIWGNVFIRTSDSMKIHTERLKWIREKRKVESDTFVQIETKKGDILRGKGLDAVEDFSKFSFKSNVTGKFPDFKKRMESEDESF